MLHKIWSHCEVSHADLKLLAELPNDGKPFSELLIESLSKFEHAPIFSMLDIDPKELKSAFEDMKSRRTPNVSNYIIQ